MCIATILGFIGKVFNGIVSVLIENGKLSIGRLLLISMFVLSMFQWSQNLDIPSTLQVVLLAVIGYVLGGKIIAGATDTIQNLKNSATNVVNQISNNTIVDNGSSKTPDIED